MKNLITSPIVLNPNNFTPLKRTPWAGSDIYSTYKKHLIKELPTRIGESWEFSCDPEMPSMIKGNNIYLKDLITSYVNELLGDVKSCDLLVKLINAWEPLSFQVHPGDFCKFLKSDECGKTESWLILRSRPSCGIYLGFSKKISKEELYETIKEKKDLKGFFNFIEVKEGDFFEITPGMPHSIGAGITLLEVQNVIFGKRGKTFRFWDWDRKYDEFGNIDSRNGKERELHIEASLEIIKTEPTINAFRKAFKREIGFNEVTEYEKNSFYQLFILKVKNPMRLSIQNSYGVLVELNGQAVLSGKSLIEIPIIKGETAFLPFSSFPVLITTIMPSVFALVAPSCSKVLWYD